MNVGAVAELAIPVCTPGPERTVRFQSHRVMVSGGYGGPVGRPGRFLVGIPLLVLLPSPSCP